MRSFTVVILSLVVYTVSGASLVSQDELTTGSTIDNEETSANNEAEELLKTIDDLLKEVESALANQPQPPFNFRPQPPFGLPHPPSFGPRPFPGFRPQHFDDDEEDDEDDDDDDDEAWIEDHKHFGGFRGFGNHHRFGGHDDDHHRFGGNKGFGNQKFGGPRPFGGPQPFGGPRPFEQNERFGGRFGNQRFAPERSNFRQNW